LWEKPCDWLLNKFGLYERYAMVWVDFRVPKNAPAASSPSANQGGASSGVEATLERKIPLERSHSRDRHSRLFGEVISLAVAVLVPLVSLLAGAKEQLAQNSSGGALVVFLLGFGSDAIISVFKQRAGASA
jgi:hypothetical protein